MISSFCDSLSSPWNSICTTVFITYQEKFWDLALITAPALLLVLLWSTFRTLRFIFHQNRGVRGAYLGRHYADRFMDIWYAAIPLRSSASKSYTFLNNRSVQSLYQIDQVLQKRGLVIVDQGNSLAVRTLRNRAIAFLCEQILICIYGDHRNQFRMMRRNYKNSIQRK